MNDFNRNVNRDDSRFIFDGCEKKLPSLKNAATLSEWVGLRPGRDTVRLELEHYKTGKTNHLVSEENHSRIFYFTTRQQQPLQR